jgi:sugar phosphate isomerase/epimerase
MRVGPLHLGYSTNVHAAETLPEVCDALGSVAAAVRERLGVERLGLGLYLSAAAAREFEAAPGRLIDEMAAHDLYVFTMNGFPFGGFHGERVKEAVYRPDWTDPARLDHTLRLARILEVLAPRAVEEPTISTVPLGWRVGWDVAREAAAAGALARLCEALAHQADRTGRAVRVCLEPESECALESTTDALAFFAGPLARLGTRELVARHLGVCFDTCHQAVLFEDLPSSLAALDRAGVVVGKMQLSSALELPDPHDADARAALAAFDEPRYLHQVRTPAGDGTADLPEALAGLSRERPWRVHFHVPIDRPILGRVRTTRGELEAALAMRHPVRALEVETYTWSVLPETDRPRDAESLAAGIARELAWVRSVLA